MDTGKTYILMCEKAEEIQTKEAQGWIGGTQQSGNIYFHTSSLYAKEVGIPGGYYYLMEEYYEDEEGEEQHRNVKTIWLPTQDQLQGMVDLELFQDVNSKTHKRYCLHDFMRFCEWGYGSSVIARQPQELFSSMEQLWLAFVQKQKWGKVWDGDKWVKC